MQNKDTAKLKSYVKPATKKHEPVKIIQGSGGCNGLYYTSLYKLFG
jgi:hypothetical protein